MMAYPYDSDRDKIESNMGLVDAPANSFDITSVVLFVCERIFLTIRVQKVHPNTSMHYDQGYIKVIGNLKLFFLAVGAKDHADNHPNKVAKDGQNGIS